MPSLLEVVKLVIVFFGLGFFGTMANLHLAALYDRAAALRLRLAERGRRRLAGQARVALVAADRDV